MPVPHDAHTEQEQKPTMAIEIRMAINEDTRIGDLRQFLTAIERADGRLDLNQSIADYDANEDLYGLSVEVVNVSGG